MDIAEALAVDLAALAEVTGDDGHQLRDALNALSRDLRVAVRSFLGLTISLEHAYAPVTLTVLEPAADVEPVRATLLLWPGLGTLMLYASRPGAFDVIADDLTALGASVTTASDHDARSRLADLDRTSLQQASMINQAIGVLIERGRSELDATAWLIATAHTAGTDLLGAARSVLDSTAPGMSP